MRYLVSCFLTLPFLISCTNEYYVPGYYAQTPHHYHGQTVSRSIPVGPVHHGHSPAKKKVIIQHPQAHTKVPRNVHGHDESQKKVHRHPSTAATGVVIEHHQ